MSSAQVLVERWHGLGLSLQAKVLEDGLELVHQRLPLADHRVQTPPPLVSV
jgi:hypothetical protein